MLNRLNEKSRKFGTNLQVITYVQGKRRINVTLKLTNEKVNGL